MCGVCIQYVQWVWADIDCMVFVSSMYSEHVVWYWLCVIYCICRGAGWQDDCPSVWHFYRPQHLYQCSLSTTRARKKHRPRVSTYAPIKVYLGEGWDNPQQYDKYSVYQWKFHNGANIQALLSISAQSVKPIKDRLKAMPTIPGPKYISVFLTPAVILHTYPVSHREVQLINYSDSDSDMTGVCLSLQITLTTTILTDII